MHTCVKVMVNMACDLLLTSFIFVEAVALYRLKQILGLGMTVVRHLDSSGN